MPLEFPDFTHGEVSEEALIRFNELLDKGPREGAEKKEYEAYMEKLLAAEGGIEMVKGLAEKLTQGGELDRELSQAAKLNQPEGYLPPQSPIRMVFRIDEVGSAPEVWARLSLPSDASFFDLRCALEDAFSIGGLPHGHCFELREQGRVAVSFSDGSMGEISEDDYCEVENRMFDIFQQGCDTMHFRLMTGEEYFIRIESVKAKEDDGQRENFAAPDLLGGSPSITDQEPIFRTL